MAPDTVDLLLTFVASGALIAAAGGALWLLPWREHEMDAAERAARGVAVQAAVRAGRVRLPAFVTVGAR